MNSSQVTKLAFNGNANATSKHLTDPTQSSYVHNFHIYICIHISGTHTHLQHTPVVRTFWRTVNLFFFLFFACPWFARVLLLRFLLLRRLLYKQLINAGIYYSRVRIHIHFKSSNKQQQLLIAFFMRLCAHTQIETESAVKCCRRHRRRRCHRHHSPRKSATTNRWNSAAAAATLRRARAQKANWIVWIRDSCRRQRSRDHPKVLSNNNSNTRRRWKCTKCGHEAHAAFGNIVHM